MKMDFAWRWQTAPLSKSEALIVIAIRVEVRDFNACFYDRKFRSYTQPVAFPAEYLYHLTPKYPKIMIILSPGFSDDENLMTADLNDDDLMEIHRIKRLDIYETGVAEFFHPQNSALPKTVERTTLESELDAAEAPDWRIEFKADDTRKNSNDEIQFDAKEPLMGGIFYINYSVKLLRALISRFAPTHFRFTKALHTDAVGAKKNDIFFQVLVNDQVVYLGDLSNAFP